MKHIAYVLCAFLLALCFFVMSHPPIFAAADAVCTAEPPAGPVGTDFHLVCRGYTPKSYVYAYVVGNSFSASAYFLDPTASEGALGEYAMSCRGDASGANAIARFCLTGAVVDP